MRFRISIQKVWMAACLTGLLWAPSSGQNTPPPPNASGLRIIVVQSLAAAQALLERIKRGEDFAKIAEASSSDPTQVDGGYMGRPDPGTLCPELREALKDVGAGQVSGLVQVPAGYAILKVLPESEVPQGNTKSSPLPWATAACALHPAILVSGFGEADAIFRGFPKSEGWEQDLHQICAIRTFNPRRFGPSGPSLGSQQTGKFERASARLDATACCLRQPPCISRGNDEGDRGMECRSAGCQHQPAGRRAHDGRNPGRCTLSQV